MNKPRMTLLIFCAIAVGIIGCMSDYVVRPGYDLPPSARIYTPTDGESYMEGDTIYFSGRGTDREDGILPEDSLVWASDIDGRIGTGTSFHRTDLSPNAHSITLMATDCDGQRDTSMVVIRVEERKPVKILFLGNSYLQYNDCAGVFRSLCESGGKEVIVDHYYIMGRDLDAHIESAESEAKICSDQWDYVIVQGSSLTMAFPGTHHEIYPPYPFINLHQIFKTLKTRIKENNSESVMVYVMPWGYEDGLTWIEGRDEDYFDMQKLICDNTISYGNLIPFTIAPVGWAWNSVMKVRPQLHYLFMSDLSHPEPRGTYLMACTIYSTIFRERSSGFTYIDGITAAEAKHFQNVGSGIVLNDLELWNIEP